jgi:tRNA (guanosine-2'-O-)-methyltransferase
MVLRSSLPALFVILTRAAGHGQLIVDLTNAIRSYDHDGFVLSGIIDEREDVSLPDRFRGKPITRRRLQRMASVLARRQPDVSIVLEDVHDPHNVSAVLRSCDATGVFDVHLVYEIDQPPELSTGVAAGTQRWLQITNQPSIDDCYAALRDQGKTIYATTLAGEALDLYDVDLTKPCALIFGNENRGLSSRAIHEADACIRIPMMGMAESLNISVACAVILFETMRQRQLAGLFCDASVEEETMRATLEHWLERDDRDLCAADDADFNPQEFPLVWPRTQPMPVDIDDDTE